jgi:DNA (cytosine-5)-methyltransferase 1
MLNVLNLYAGIGGNRSAWPIDWSVTAVELDVEISKVYAKRFPTDTLIVGDALAYGEEHFAEFDFIWSSPPCPSHGQYRHNVGVLAKGYRPLMPDMSLYAQIVFLRQYAPKWWCVENVKPYYEPLIAPNATLQRHLVWTNIAVTDLALPATHLRTKNALASFGDLASLVAESSIKNKRQVLRNCVAPEVGAYVARCIECATLNAGGTECNG